MGLAKFNGNIFKLRLLFNIMKERVIFILIALILFSNFIIATSTIDLFFSDDDNFAVSKTIFNESEDFWTFFN